VLLRYVVWFALAGCAVEAESRERRIVNVLAGDNYEWSLRDPALVALKLHKMQRGPYEWLRGSAALYWRDVTEQGDSRATTAFGSPAASRVLLLGDAHLENAGTFRASDGTMFIDWNDFDATGYGPYHVEVRRLAASFVIVAGIGAPSDSALPAELSRAVATGYTTTIAALAGGARIGAVGEGASALFDAELKKSKKRGDAGYAVEELAPVTAGVRTLALGDLEPDGTDGVIEDRVVEVQGEQVAWIDRAVAAWAPGKLDAAAATIKLRARRIGSGVASYAAYRYQVVLEGATPAPDDDRVIELKETRDGLAITETWQREASAWNTPAERAAITQQRLQARDDGDGLLGHTQVGALSLKIRDREAYQRGINAEDLGELARTDRAQLLLLANLYGGMLARAHGQALTADRERGYLVIAPLLTGREAEFADEVATLAIGDAAQIAADYEAMKSRNLEHLIVARIR